eukprot:TRINITY_DN17971_c0_g2_i16.p4 TRINITY_DN17971_c0_g2~~TRINITY_DN17971_c0_g2_i16.p4  ORF type:complete len:112 (-),score=0.15 TRINITY_DN17971_c0_g2_i16:464-799(-)
MLLQCFQNAGRAIKQCFFNFLYYKLQIAFSCQNFIKALQMTLKNWLSMFLKVQQRNNNRSLPHFNAFQPHCKIYNAYNARIERIAHLEPHEHWVTMLKNLNFTKIINNIDR